MLKMEHVDGNDKAKIVLFALSTCGWCGRTKKYLESLGMSFSYINVDSLSTADNKEALQELKQWNLRLSFPTMVVNDEQVVIGYNEAKIKEAIGLS